MSTIQSAIFKDGCRQRCQYNARVTDVPSDAERPLVCAVAVRPVHASVLVHFGPVGAVGRTGGCGRSDRVGTVLRAAAAARRLHRHAGDGPREPAKSTSLVRHQRAREAGLRVGSIPTEDVGTRDSGEDGNR